MELNEDAKLVFDAMREGITIIDTQGHIVFGNRAYREFLSKEAGGDIGPIEGYALRDLRPGARLPDVLASGKPVLHITRKEIEDFYFVNMYPIYAQGELVGGVSVVTFLEDAYQARDELEAMGLGVPAMTRVFARLRSMGVDIPPSVYTIPQAREAVLAALHRGLHKAENGGRQAASDEKGAE